MPFTPQEIAEKEFLYTMRGYDRAEVKAFLRAVAADMAQMRAEVEALKDSVPLGEHPRDRALAESIEAAMFVQATESIAAILETAQAEARQIRLEARERSEEWLRWAKELAEMVVATAQTAAVVRIGQAVDSSDGVLEEVRTSSEVLVTAASAGTEEMLTVAQESVIQAEAAHEDLRQRLAFTQDILGDLAELAGGTSALDRPSPTVALESATDEPSEDEVVVLAPDAR